MTAQEGALSRGALVLQGRQLGNGAEAGPHEFLQGLKGLGCRRAFMRIHDGGEHGEHAGVQRVGLGQDAVGFGEHAHEVGIDDGGSEASGMEAAVQGPVPLAGGLKDNQVYAEALQLTLELADTGGRVGDAPRDVLRQHMDIPRQIRSNFRRRLAAFNHGAPACVGTLEAARCRIWLRSCRLIALSFDARGGDGVIWA